MPPQGTDLSVIALYPDRRSFFFSQFSFFICLFFFVELVYLHFVGTTVFFFVFFSLFISRFFFLQTFLFWSNMAGLVSSGFLLVTRNLEFLPGFYRVLPGFGDLRWVLLSFTEFYRVLPSFTEFYRVLPGFYRVSVAFDSVSN